MLLMNLLILLRGLIERIVEILSCIEPSVPSSGLLQMLQLVDAHLETRAHRRHFESIFLVLNQVALILHAILPPVMKDLLVFLQEDLLTVEDWLHLLCHALTPKCEHPWSVEGPSCLVDVP